MMNDGSSASISKELLLEDQQEALECDLNGSVEDYASKELCLQGSIVERDDQIEADSNSPEEGNCDQAFLLQDQESPKALADDLEDNDDDFDFVQKDEAPPNIENLSPYDLEMREVGGEVIFPQSSTSVPSPWNNLNWMSYSRSVRFCDVCTRVTLGQKKWFAGSPVEVYETRKLAIYDEPNLILILRTPAHATEVQTILDIGDEPVDPRNYLVAETVIDPMTCMLRLSPLTTPTSIEASGGSENISPHRRSCFELVTPSETVLLSAMRPREDRAVMQNSVGFLETKTMEIAIANALFAAHSAFDHDRESDSSWKHQLVLGTLTSFVVSGSQSQLERAIIAALARKSVPSSTLPVHVIDQMDDLGRTALHYACMTGNCAAVTALIRAGANVSIPISSDEGELLPIHLAAKSLDHMSLSTILSAPRRPDPNAVDGRGRTAMYLAATEGSSDDPTALSKCLSALEAWGGTLGSGGNILSVLAARWAHNSLRSVLANQSYRYPLPSPGVSVSAYHFYPLHTALVSLRRKIQAISSMRTDHGFLGGDNAKAQLRGTLQILLEHGFEPNERLDQFTDQIEGRSDLLEHKGFTPLQILAVAAIDAEQLSKSGIKISSSILASVAGTLANASDVLLQCGARMNIEPPPLQRFTRNQVPIKSLDRECSLPEINRHRIKIDGNPDLMDLLGGKKRLEACSKTWQAEKVTKAPGKLTFDEHASMVECDAPGGSSDKSCAICWSIFGSMLNRKHKCRISLKYVCDDCSSKRITCNNQDVRVSDGQFLLARADVAREKMQIQEEHKESLRRRQEQLEVTRMQRLEKEKNEQAQRESLFGGIMEKATNFLIGDDEKDEVMGLQSTLEQTRDALNERGERLNSLSEKTEMLMNASEEFAKMAKELEKSQRGIFSW